MSGNSRRGSRGVNDRIKVGVGEVGGNTEKWRRSTEMRG